MKLDDLKKAYGPVPAGFHEALQSAVSDVKEEPKVKKVRVGLLAAALITMLLCGTAFALISHYSVRDFQAGGKPSAVFEKHIVEIGQTYENDFITLTMGDAIFDGKSLAVTMDLYSKDEAKPVYLYPQIKGYCGERELDIDITGMRGDFQSGFLYPNVLEGDQMEHHYGFELDLFEDAADSDVDWTFTMKVLTTDWPVADASAALAGIDSDPMDAYLSHFRDAYADHRILVTCGEGLWEYVAANGNQDSGKDYGDEIAALDAFTLSDIITCSFTTKLPKSTEAAVQSFSFEDRDVTVDSLSASVMSVSYQVTQTFAEPLTEEPTLYAFALYDQNGNQLSNRWSNVEMDDGGTIMTVTGEAQVGADALTHVTFKPCTYSVDSQGMQTVTYDESHAFTVELKNAK